jgi:hypothetical protein
MKIVRGPIRHLAYIRHGSDKVRICGTLWNMIALQKGTYDSFLQQGPDTEELLDTFRHESVHQVLDKIEGWKTCEDFDNIDRIIEQERMLDT